MDRMLRLAVLVVLGVAWLQPSRVLAENSAAPSELPPVECVQMLRSARAALDLGDEQGGVELLREAVERFPEELVALVALWDYHREYGLPGDEAVRLRAILTERLQDPEASLPPGVLRYLAEDSATDKEDLALLLAAAQARLKKNDVEMLRVIVDLQLQLGLLEEARETYRRLADLASLEMLNWDAVLLDIKLERWADAAAGLKPFVAKSDAPLAARVLYIDALSRLGQYEEMLRQIARIPSSNPAIAEVINVVLRDSAWNLRDAGKDAEAEAVFRKVLAANPEDTQAQAALLYLYGTEEELQAYREALETAQAAEADPYVLLEQGGNLLAAGDAEQALELLERASAGLPDDEIVWFNLGLAALKLERWEIAESAFQRATKINPERPDSFLNRGSALYRLGRCAEAIEVLERTLKLAPGQTNAYYYLYACHAELGNSEAAAEAKRLYDAR